MSTAPAVPTRRRWLVAGAGLLLLLLAVAVVVAARAVLASEGGRAFVAAYPGVAPQPASTPVGFDAWAAWTHALNATFLLFTVRSGWRIHRGGRPTTFWTRRNDGRLRTRNPPIRVGIDLWSHYVADTLWVVNGALYLVLTAATGHWLRLVPTDWGVVPAAVSAGLQYAAFQWPSENGWIHYNGLQQLSYFAVVYVAGPVAVLTGLRAAPGFAARLRPLDRVLPLRTAKRVHWWTMWFLVGFTVVHVLLVLLTGAIRNLNHIYAVRDDTSPVGLVVFLVSLVATALLVAAARPAMVRRAAARTGTLLHRPLRGGPRPGP